VIDGQLSKMSLSPRESLCEYTGHYRKRLTRTLSLPVGKLLDRGRSETVRVSLLCFSQKLDPQHPLQHHEPPPEPMKQ